MRFLTHLHCTECALHKQARTPGVPSALYREGGEDALIALGQNPGKEEDKAGAPFIGPSGQWLKRVYLDPLVRAGLDLTIYLMNPARCGPISPVPEKAWKTCFGLHSISEIDQIVAAHERVVILCCGATACNATSWYKLGSLMSQQESFSHQGWEWAENAAVFSTYHPAAVLRKKALGHAVADHLELVRSWFLCQIPQVSQPRIVEPYLPCESASTLRPTESQRSIAVAIHSHRKQSSTPSSPSPRTESTTTT